MDTEVTMVGATVETQVDAERDRSPCRVLTATVKADLIGAVDLELLEDLLALGFGCEGGAHCWFDVSLFFFFFLRFCISFQKEW